MDVPLLHIELVDPGLPEDLHRRHLSQPARGSFVIHPSQEQRAISSYHLCVASPFSFSLGKMILLYALTIAFKPCSRDPGPQPVRSHSCDAVESCSQGFPQTLQSV